MRNRWGVSSADESPRERVLGDRACCGDVVGEGDLVGKKKRLSRFMQEMS